MRPRTGPGPTPLRVALLVVFATMLAAGIAGPALAQQRHAVVGVVDGAINPVTQRYISRVIKKGEEDGAEVVIIKLDTPGGLLSSTQKITEDLLRDRVPTVVYVYPSGGGAFSAGTFITAAANFAVMAPSTSIGAASPVGVGGEELPETIKSKVMEALAADMRGIARIRDRNPEALEASVLEAKAYDEAEALELNVVDFVVRDMTGLLAAINGRTVELVSGPRTLNTSDLVLREVNMTFIEKFLFFLADPNISFLLLSVGSLGLVIELFHPGLIVPAVVGVIFLVLAFLSLGNLPVNWAGVGLILFAMVLLIAEILVAGFGVLGIGAIVAFILGGLILFSGTGLPDSPSPKVNLWVVVSFAAIVFGGGGWVMWTMVRSRRTPEAPGLSRLVGQIAEVTADLNPRGTVSLENETWSAVAQDSEEVAHGERVEVLAIEGLVLTVRKLEEPPESSADEAPT